MCFVTDKESLVKVLETYQKRRKSFEEMKTGLE